MVTIYDMAAGVAAEADNKSVSSYTNLLKGAGVNLGSRSQYLHLKGASSNVWIHFTLSPTASVNLNVQRSRAWDGSTYNIQVGPQNVVSGRSGYGSEFGDGGYKQEVFRPPTSGLKQYVLNISGATWRMYQGETLLHQRVMAATLDCSNIYLGGVDGGGTSLAHIYVADEYLPNAFVEVLRPNGNGASSDFVGSDGNSTNNFELIDEATASATDYVGTALTGKADFYTLTDLGADVSEVFAVKPQLYGMKSDAGTPPDTAAVLRESGGTTNSLPLSDISAVTMQIITNDIANTKPSGGAWSKSVVDAMQLGLQT